VRGRGWVPQGAHKGHVTAMAGLEGETAVGGGAPLLLTGGQDGVLRVWDARQANCVKEQPLHVGSRGAGASSPHARVTPEVVLPSYGSFFEPRVVRSTTLSLSHCHQAQLRFFSKSNTAERVSTGAGAGDGTQARWWPSRRARRRVRW